MACLTSVIEPLRAANEISGNAAFDWKLIGERMGKVPSSAEVAFEPSCALAEADGLDLLVVLSAPTAAFEIKSTPGRLRAMARHGVSLGAVSGGVFPLVRAGLAGSNRLAVHWCYRAAFDAEFPEHNASDQVIEVTPQLITAAGAAAAFDLALHLIETRLGAGVATEVACWFQHPVMRRAGVAQAVPSLEADKNGEQLSPLVARAVQIFADNIAEPISISEAADQLGISARHIERAFKQTTGVSPSHYYRKLRMEAARQIVLYTNDRLSDVAGAVGYTSMQTFSKHYQTAFEMTPTQDRNRINLFRVKGNLPVPSV